MFVLTRNGLRIDFFVKTYQRLNEENLLLNAENNSGVVLLTVEDNYAKQLEYLVVAPDVLSVHALENRVNDLLLR